LVICMNVVLSWFRSQRQKPFGIFSNYSLHGFDLDGASWMTSEHYYQGSHRACCVVVAY